MSFRIPFTKTHPLIKKWAVPTVFGKGKLANDIRSQSKLVKTLFKTPLPCTSTLFAFYYRTRFEKSPSLNATRTYIDHEDGGLIGIDKMNYGDKQKGDDGKTSNKPVVLIFPGGNENTFSTKVQTLCSTYLNAGYKDVFMCNYRGKCNTPFKTPQFSMPYGRFNDISKVVEYINSEYKGQKILLSGDCFGGNHIVDYLATDNAVNNSSVIGGVAHSVQWNGKLSNAKLTIEPNYSLFVKPWAKMTKNLLISGKKGSETFGDMVLEKIGVENFSTLKALSMESPNDVHVLYKLGLSALCDTEFLDEDDYITKVSSHNRSVRKPTLIINSADDPTSPFSEEDITNIELNPNLCFWFFACGGHCGYVKSMFPVSNFIDDVMIECSDIIVKNNS